MEFAGGGLLARADGTIGWLIVNRPERRNAVNGDMWRALPNAVAHLLTLPGLRAIVLRGAGETAFVSGADISEFETIRQSSSTNADFTAVVTAATAALEQAPVPVIAMIHGFCIGGGVVLSSACDLRVASDTAVFGVPAGKLGLGYELDNLKRLVRVVGPSFAMEMLATARRFPADHALRMGYLNRVVPSQELEATVREYVADIAALAPMSLAAAKLGRRAAFDASLDGVAQAAIDACFDSQDFAEGRLAFREKRRPTFIGR